MCTRDKSEGFKQKNFGNKNWQTIEYYISQGILKNEVGTLEMKLI